MWGPASTLRRLFYEELRDGCTWLRSIRMRTWSERSRQGRLDCATKKFWCFFPRESARLTERCGNSRRARPFSAQASKSRLFRRPSTESFRFGLGIVGFPGARFCRGQGRECNFILAHRWSLPAFQKWRAHPKGRRCSTLLLPSSYARTSSVCKPHCEANREEAKAQD